MPTTEITVSFVNQPKEGKKMGSIKASDGTYYNVWPDKLYQFEKGKTYTVQYETNDQGFHSIKSVKAPKANGVASPQSVGVRDERMAEDIFVTGFLGRVYQGTGSVPSGVELTGLLKDVRRSWRASLEPVKPLSSPKKAKAAEPEDEELNDEVPF